jgi:hypothetical protein
VATTSDQLLEFAPDAILEVDAQGRITMVSREAERLFGYQADELLGQPVEILMPPRVRELHALHRALFAQAPRQRRMGEGTELLGYRKDGAEFPAEISLHPVPASDGVHVLSFVREVSGRKRTEETLRAFQAQVEGAPYGIYRATREGKLLTVNPALVEMLGYSSKEELLQVDLARDVYRDPGERARVVESAASTEYFRGVEVHWKRKDGTPLTVRLSGRSVFDARGELLYFEDIAENVTQQRALEEQLRQAQKMEAIGRLAGGIAHDFNNLLMVIRGYSELIHLRLGAESPLQAMAEEIRKATDHASALTQQLLAFGRRQALEPRVLSLNAVLAETEQMLRRLLSEDIELVIRRDPDLGLVRVDQAQMLQVILNLAANARDAMPGGGTLVLETCNVNLDPSYASLHPPLPAGSYVQLIITDTGVGMDEKTRQRIFEPFFTTKELGKGTGLGLATVYGIVKQSGGFIWVYSELSRGTAFKIYLPRVQETQPPKPADLPPPQLVGGTETILLVEDEPAVRKLTRDFLEVRGFRVLDAGNGEEALHVCQAHPGPHSRAGVRRGDAADERPGTGGAHHAAASGD